MKVIVTGGAGFIGSHLVNMYVSRGFDVVIIDDLSSGTVENLKSTLNKVRLYELPVQSSEILGIFEREKPDFVNHHAAQKSVRDSVDHPLKDADINILGLINVLEAARRVRCKNIIFASSGGVVYGDQLTFPAEETHPKRPVSPYGVSKLASELYLDFYAMQHQLNSVALRYANVFGPRQDPLGEAGVVAIFCQQLRAGNTSKIYGTGQQTRDFVYVDDIVEANKRATDALMSSKVQGFNAFNVGTACETSVNQIFESLSRIAHSKKAPQYEAAKSGEQLRSVLSFDKIKKELEWKPQWTVDRGLEATYHWFTGDVS